MKKVYRKIISIIEKSIVNLHIVKTWVFEWLSIFSKKNQYKNVKWSTDQQEMFDEFWQKNYGKKISNRWHKLYQSTNDIFDITYLPEIIYTTKLEPKLNELKIAKVLEDKSFVEILYSSVVEIKFPETIVLNCSGILYDNERNLIDNIQAKNKLSNSNPMVIKPICGTSSGDGVKMLNIKNNINKDDGLSIEDIFKEYENNFIVQEKLKQHSIIGHIYEDSVNTIRIITYILNNKIFHVPITMRFGAEGQQVDNIHAGGIAIGVCDDGILKGVGFDNNNKKFTEHPDTNVAFKGYSIPFIPGVIEAAYKAHQKTPHIGMVSWDFMINEKSEIILIEANLIGQSIWFPQIVNGKGVFEGNTEEILNYLSK